MYRDGSASLDWEFLHNRLAYCNQGAGLCSCTNGVAAVRTGGSSGIVQLYCQVEHPSAQRMIPGILAVHFPR